MNPITIGARDSHLSKIQVEEVVNLFNLTGPIHKRFVESRGDRDQETSLRYLGKDDFFTRDIDRLLLSGEVDLAVHSAKDLPETLAEELQLIALTPGLDPRDVLVFRKGDELTSLSPGALIGTSSERREAAVNMVRSDFNFIDLRGTIHSRLLKLITKQLDGVVVAEAALIRLGLTHLNRMYLPGEAAPLQGRLAVIARKDHHEIKRLFRGI